MTPEGYVKEDIKKGLEAYPMPYFMPVQTGYGKRDVDFRCTLPPYGTSLLIEAKRADYDGVLTTTQRNVLSENACAGGLSVCALCWADVLHAINLYDRERGMFVDYNHRHGHKVQRF